MPDDPEKITDEEQDDDDEPRIYRVHGITKHYARGPHKVMTRRRIIVEDEDGYLVRVLVEHDTSMHGENSTLSLEDEELVELIRSLELVAKRRGLIDAVRLVGTTGT